MSDTATPCDTWDAEKSIVIAVAPVLGNAASGPLAGLAASFIKHALGLDASASISQLAAALRSVTVDQLQTLRKADMEFVAQMEALDISTRTMALEGTDEAINRYTVFPEVFALMITLLFFSLLGVFVWHPIPSGQNETVLNVMLGAVAASFTTVVSYFFGSTRASGRKDLMLYNSKPQ